MCITQGFQVETWNAMRCQWLINNDLSTTGFVCCVFIPESHLHQRLWLFIGFTPLQRLRTPRYVGATLWYLFISTWSHIQEPLVLERSKSRKLIWPEGKKGWTLGTHSHQFFFFISLFFFGVDHWILVTFLQCLLCWGIGTLHVILSVSRNTNFFFPIWRIPVPLARSWNLRIKRQEIQCGFSFQHAVCPTSTNELTKTKTLTFFLLHRRRW